MRKGAELLMVFIDSVPYKVISFHETATHSHLAEYALEVEVVGVVERQITEPVQNLVFIGDDNYYEYQSVNLSSSTVRLGSDDSVISVLNGATLRKTVR